MVKIPQMFSPKLKVALRIGKKWQSGPEIEGGFAPLTPPLFYNYVSKYKQIRSINFVAQPGQAWGQDRTLK